MLYLKNIFLSLVMIFITGAGNAQYVPSSVNDFSYITKVHEKTYNYDYRSIDVEGRRILLETAPNSGMEIGVSVGADYFNNQLTPTAGAEAGYHGKRWSLAAGVAFGKGQYNEKSYKAGESYLVTNFYLDGGVRICDLPSRYLHQREVFLVGEFGYKVRKNSNKYTQKDVDGALSVDVKGSTMTYGLGVKFDFKNYMRKSNLYIKAMAYTGQEYFAKGAKKRFGASLTIGFNFVLSGKHSVNNQAIKKIFGSYDVYKETVRNMRH